MSPIKCLLLGALSLGFVGCSESPSEVQKSSESKFSISGTVRTIDNKTLANVKVRLNQQGSFATTDSTGSWTISGTAILGTLSSSHDTLEYSYNGKVFLRDTISDFNLSGIQRIFDTTWNSSLIYGYFADVRDNQIYRTIAINGTLWMAENLNFQSNDSWWYKGSGQIDANISVDEILTKGKNYGRLYSWAEIQNLPDSCDTSLCLTAKGNEVRQGLCPTGWHVATDSDWVRLLRYIDPNTVALDNTAGRKLMSASGWPTEDSAMRHDAYGFRAMPGGGRWPGGAFSNAGYMAMWWSSSETGKKYASDVYLSSSNKYANKYEDTKDKGFSVRCVRD